MIAYLRAELVYSVVVRGNAAAAEIDPSADVAVAYVGQVSNCGVHADIAVLYLHEIAYLHALADSRAGSELCKRTYLHIVFYNGIVCLNIVELYVVADGAVFNVGVCSDGAAFSYGRISEYNRVREYRGVAAYPDVSSDYDTVQRDEAYALVHEPGELA